MLIVDSEIHFLHPPARTGDFQPGAAEPVRRIIYDHPDFPLLQGLMGAEALLESMDSNEIDYGIIMGMPWLDPGIQRDNNDYVECVIKKNSERFRGMYIPNMNDPDCAAQEIENLNTEIFRGVKVVPGLQNFRIDDPQFEPVAKVIEARGLPLMVHTDHLTQSLDGDAPYRLLQFLKKHPEITVLAPHLGGLLCLYAEMDKIESHLENVFFITSVSATMKMVEFAAMVNSDNVMFGTDFPFNHCHDQKTPLKELMELDLTENVKRKICGKTARELFKIDEWN